MTCEVCVINRKAVVMAADSAVTISVYDKDLGQQRRYLKSANKIFQLCSNSPIGMMVYGNGSLNGIPWEVAVKEYRFDKQNSFQTVPEYAEDFIAYLESNSLIRSGADYSSDNNTLAYLTHFTFDGAIKNAQAQSDINDDIIADLKQHTDESAVGNFSIPEIEEIVKSHQNIFEATLAHFVTAYADNPKVSEIQIDAIAAALVKAAISIRTQEYAGMVFSGFGKEDLFPSLVEYHLPGYVFKKLIRKRHNSVKITHQHRSELKQYAMDDTIDAFVHGTNKAYFQKSVASFRESMGGLADAIISGVGENYNIDKSEIIDKISSSLETTYKSLEAEFGKSILGDVISARDTFRQTIDSLSVEEMADLAENMVSIESLREKMTQPSQSVGGPVDVAIISRHDGLIWVKRKHYFDPKLNVRYIGKLMGHYAQS